MAIRNAGKRTANSKLGHVLSPSTRLPASGGSDAILANMYRTMLKELNINEIQWDQLMNYYLQDKRNCIPNNNRDQSSARGNLQKEILKDKMSWKVFCKGLRFLNIAKFDLTIKAYHPNGKVTEHVRTVNLGDAMFDREFNETKDNEDNADV